jgi:hypothetical protein
MKNTTPVVCPHLQLCYKAWHPLEILTENRVRVSVIDRRERGLSFSSYLGLWSHGPFQFVFQTGLPWYGQFTPCTYDPKGPLTQLNKKDFFADEAEWWSPVDVQFQREDIVKVVFMADSPGARIYPIKTKRTWKQVQQQFGDSVLLETDSKRYPPDFQGSGSAPLP